MTRLDGMFGIGQIFLEAEERALFELRREHSISDDSPSGWRTLALLLARQYISGFPYHKELIRRRIIEALAARIKSPRGRKRMWGPKVLAALLDCVENWKATHPYPYAPGLKRTDKEAVEALQNKHPDVFKDLKATYLCNLVSRARREAERETTRAALSRRSNTLTEIGRQTDEF